MEATSVWPPTKNSSRPREIFLKRMLADWRLCGLFLGWEMVWVDFVSCLFFFLSFFFLFFFVPHVSTSAFHLMTSRPSSCLSLFFFIFFSLTKCSFWKSLSFFALLPCSLKRFHLPLHFSSNATGSHIYTDRYSIAGLDTIPTNNSLLPFRRSCVF